MKKWNKATKVIVFGAALILLCFMLGFLLNCFLVNDYVWRISWDLVGDKNTYIYGALFIGTILLLYLMYYHKHYWLKNSHKIINGNKRDNNVAANLEQAHFQTDKEIQRNFGFTEYGDLGRKAAGIPIRAEQNGKRYNIALAQNTHALIIGTTGSGKTTSFINPSIQILSATKDKPSMIVGDSKGELYMLHAKSLEAKGYDIKVVDLRNPFNSIKWNPLEKPFLSYQRMLRLDDEVAIDNENAAYIFEGNAYQSDDDVKNAVRVRKQQMFDEIYEDLHDIIMALCPITNKNEPIWESGAKNFALAVIIAMLEDSAIPELGMTVDKFNFYNLMKIATNTDNNCEELIKYFANRSPISRCVTLSKQVIESADKTRGSYLSTLFDKLNIFSDISLCNLTSENELVFEDLANKPTVLFLQIPDERETRYTLASMLILQSYKDLVKKANSYPTLSLPRPVYFLLDEFGNLPAVHKLEQMITVGRSRNIWLNLVVQSYAQLAKVYDEKVAEIIKSNCNIQIFIGTSDPKTIEDFSKQCGNYSVITRSYGYNTVKADDINSNGSIKERPLIYPSELRQLNNPQNMGNAIVTVFGFQPIKSKFTPSFAVKRFKLEKTEQKPHIGRYFDEEKVYFDIRKRNKLARPQNMNPPTRGGNNLSKELDMKNQLIMQQAERCLKEVLTDEEQVKMLQLLEKRMYSQALKLLEIANARANEFEYLHLIDSIDHLRRQILTAVLLLKEKINQIGGND